MTRTLWMMDARKKPGARGCLPAEGTGDNEALV